MVDVAQRKQEQRKNRRRGPGNWRRSRGGALRIVQRSASELRAPGINFQSSFRIRPSKSCPGFLLSCQHTAEQRRKHSNFRWASLFLFYGRPLAGPPAVEISLQLWADLRNAPFFVSSTIKGKTEIRETRQTIRRRQIYLPFSHALSIRSWRNASAANSPILMSALAK